MADDSEEMDIHSKWLDWTWTLGQLFQQPENEMVTSAINKLPAKISRKFDTEVLIHKLETMNKEAKELAKETPFNHWIFTSPGAMIGGTLVCLFMLFCCWRICQNSSPAATPAPYPSAPPGPPTVFNMTVDPIRPLRTRLSLKTILFHFCIASCKVALTSVLFHLSLKTPKQRERYTITNTLRLLIYTSTNTFSNLKYFRHPVRCFR
jgi:hypothetical protein